MTDLPKFHVKNPTTKEEKLIVELIQQLNSTTDYFARGNFKGNITHDQFVILRDASIGYAGSMVRDLGKLLAEKEQVIPFLTTARKIFDAYMETLERELL